MKINPESKKISWMFTRYISIILLGLGNLYIFYKVLTPLTIKSVAGILSISRDVVVQGTLITQRAYTIDIVPACVAGAAFYLMLILILSTPKIAPKKRALILITSFISLFILNILRIFYLIHLIGRPSFDAVHWVAWHVLSTIFVVGIWISIVYLFKIKAIPIYTDFKYTFNLVKKSSS